MIRASQIPDEVVEAARYAFHNATGPTVADDWRAALTAALNAWPGMMLKLDGRYALLPLPQENTNAES